MYCAKQVELAAANKLDNNVDYIAQLHFFQKDLTLDNDFTVAICDAHECLGFFYLEQGVSGRVARKTWANVGTACKTGSTNEEELPGSSLGHHIIRFEIRANATVVGFTWSDPTYAYAGDFAKTLRPATGLSLHVCRNEPNEDYKFGFFEFALRTNKR